MKRGSDELRQWLSRLRKSKRYKSPGMTGKHQSKKWYERMSGENSPMWGRKVVPSDDTRRKQRNAKLGTRNPMYGKTHSAEACRKMRIVVTTRIGQVYPNHNPAACRLIEAYGKQHDYSFQHAENGGEFHIKGLGYWVDGYDKDKNVVIEVYEPHHRKTKHRDARRQREIEQHLGCEFIVLWI